MSDSFLQIFLWLAGAYLGFGALFGAAFALWGAARIDATAADGSFGFKLLIVPGAALLWPVLLSRWRRVAGEMGPLPGGPVRAPGLQGDESGAGGGDRRERRQQVSAGAPPEEWAAHGGANRNL